MGSSLDLSSISTWSFLSEALARDTEALTQALQKSISDTTPSYHRSQSNSSSGGSEPESVSKRVSRNPVPPMGGKITKRKSRASKRSATTYITADPSNFRQMVQQVTGVGFSSSQTPVGVMNRVQTGCLLPTLDTSAFLLEHHRQKVASAAVVVGHSSLVPEAGSFEGISCFPTLDSWKLI